MMLPPAIDALEIYNSRNTEAYAARRISPTTPGIKAWLDVDLYGEATPSRDTNCIGAGQYVGPLRPLRPARLPQPQAKLAGDAHAPRQKSAVEAFPSVPKQSTLRRSRSSYALAPAKADLPGQAEDPCALLHRCKSLSTMTTQRAQEPQHKIEIEERERELEAKEAVRATMPSRMHCMRHVVGFRTYNKLPDLRRKIVETCEIIESMARSQHGAYQVALNQVDTSLKELAKAEHLYYKAADRVKCYEKKADELEYLKNNVALCIKESFPFMKNKYRTEYLPLLGDRSELKEEQKWRDYKELCIFVNQLKANLESSQSEDEKSKGIPSLLKAQREIREARALCVQRRDWRGLLPLFEAEDQLVELRSHLDKIQRSESLLKASLLRYQASTNTLLNVNREIKATVRILKAKAELAASLAESKTRDLNEEERLLRDFVINARHYDSASPLSVSSSFTSQASLLSLSPTTPLTPGTSPPVYATSWSDNTKVLPKLNERQLNEQRKLKY